MLPVIRKSDRCVVAVVAAANDIHHVNEHIITINGATFGADGGFEVLTVDVGEGAVGCFENAGHFVAPSVPEPEADTDEDIDAHRAQRLNDLNTRCAAVIGKLQADYPVAEVISWSQQAGEARALLADAGASAPLVSAIASTRGVAVELLANKIMAKAQIYAAFSGAAFGNRQRLEDELINAMTLAAIDAVNVEDGWPVLPASV